MQGRNLRQAFPSSAQHLKARPGTPFAPLLHAELQRRSAMASTASKSKAEGITERKVKKVMHEFKEGELESSSGDQVRSRKQAVAIALSEARRAGGKAPPPPKAKKGH
jgi:hypothetical protein